MRTRAMRMGAGLAALLAVCLASLTFVSAAQSQAFTNSNVRRIISLASSNGVDVALSLTVTRKEANADKYLVTLPSEAEGGKVSRAACDIDNVPVKDLQVDKSSQGVVLKVPVPASFTGGSIKCNV